MAEQQPTWKWMISALIALLAAGSGAGIWWQLLQIQQAVAPDPLVSELRLEAIALLTDPDITANAPTWLKEAAERATPSNASLGKVLAIEYAWYRKEPSRANLEVDLVLRILRDLR